MDKLKVLSKDINNLITNFLSLSVLQALNIFLPLLTFPYLIRVLEVENFGLVMFAQSFVYYFAIFIDYGFDYSATREISINRHDKEKITEIFSVVLLIKIIFIIISFLLLYLIISFIDKFHLNSDLYLLSFTYVIGNAMIPIWYFQGHEDMKYVTYINLIAKGVFTILIFIFIKNSGDYLYVPMLNGLGYIIASVFSMLLIFKRYNESFKLYDKQTIIKYLKDSTDYFLSRISVSMFTSSNVFVLGMFVNMTTVGYFSVSEKLYNAIRSLYGPVSTTLYPYMSGKKNISLYKKIFTSIFFANMIFVSFLFYYAPFVIEIISGEKMDMSVNIFRIFMVFCVFTVPSSLLGYSFLAALGFKRYANYSVIIASLFHVAGLFLLSLFDQVTVFNIVYMIAFSEFIVLIIRLYAINKHKLWLVN